MASKAKNQKQASNILYLQDADAKALGIVEGSTQRVFVDNREVEVIFVDEHEVIPVSNEEKKLYEEAYKIASKYAELSESATATPTSTSLVAKTDGKVKEPKVKQPKEAKEPSQWMNNVKDSISKTWNNFCGKFKKSDEAKKAKAERVESRELAIRSKEDKKLQARQEYEQAKLNQKRHAKHSIRNDIFTEEELEIIQNVIDKSKSSTTTTSPKSKNSKAKAKR